MSSAYAIRRRNKKIAVRAVAAWLLATNGLTAIETGRAVYVNAPKQMLVDEQLVKDTNVFQKGILLVGGVFYGAVSAGNAHMKSFTGAHDFCTDFSLTHGVVRGIENQYSRNTAMPFTLHQGVVGFPGAVAGSVVTGLGMSVAELWTGGKAQNTHACAARPA